MNNRRLTEFSPLTIRRAAVRTSLAIMSATGMLAMMPAQPVMADEYWEQRVSLFDTLPASPNDIIFLGNSLTDGSEFAEFFKNPDIKNRGIRSDVIDGVRRRLSQVTKGRPRKIFLLIGINDVSHRLSSSQLAKKYETLVKEIRSQTPETELVLQSVLPVNNSFGRYKNLIGTEKTIAAFNDSIAAIASRNGTLYVDLTPVMSDSNGNLKKSFTNDGLHLNGSGYSAWGNAIAPFVGVPRIEITD